MTSVRLPARGRESYGASTNVSRSRPAREQDEEASACGSWRLTCRGGTRAWGGPRVADGFSRCPGKAPRRLAPLRVSQRVCPGQGPIFGFTLWGWVPPVVGLGLPALLLAVFALTRNEAMSIVVARRLVTLTWPTPWRAADMQTADRPSGTEKT